MKSEADKQLDKWLGVPFPSFVNPIAYLGATQIHRVRRNEKSVAILLSFKDRSTMLLPTTELLEYDTFANVTEARQCLKDNVSGKITVKPLKVAA